LLPRFGVFLMVTAKGSVIYCNEDGDLFHDDDDDDLSSVLTSA